MYEDEEVDVAGMEDDEFLAMMGDMEERSETDAVSTDPDTWYS